MKPMIWRPEPHDKKVNEYLDRVNHEPWLGMFAVAVLVVCVFTGLILLGAF